MAHHAPPDLKYAGKRTAWQLIAHGCMLQVHHLCQSQRHNKQAQLLQERQAQTRKPVSKGEHSASADKPPVTQEQKHHTTAPPGAQAVSCPSLYW